MEEAEAAKPTFKFKFKDRGCRNKTSTTNYTTRIEIMLMTATPTMLTTMT